MKKYIGKETVFAGYDGRFYDATIIGFKRGLYEIAYTVRTDGGAYPLTTFLDTKEAKARLVVQL